MTAFVEYVTATGQIVRIAGEEITAGDGRAVLAVPVAPDPKQAWVTTVDEVLGIYARPAAPVLPETMAGGVSLSGLPVGTTVEIIGPLDADPATRSGTVGEAGTISAAIPAAGIYQVRIEPPWPQQAILARMPVTAGDAPTPAAVHLDLPVPLAALKAKAIARVDIVADVLARLIVTPGAAMPMIYLRKADEAAAVLALATPNDADPAVYPLVASEAAVDSVGMEAAATTIATSAGVFALVGAIWDRLRLEAKRDIRVANASAGIATAEATVNRATFEARLTAAGLDPALVLGG